ncbi:MAG TPA: arginine--tRNA ligase [Candidatus Saccharimonadales bacterium]|nr:arginine--tRNA ligase [Candidatus Saccharimonadales bacterium]
MSDSSVPARPASVTVATGDAARGLEMGGDSLRRRVRQAVEEAWARAVESGVLPALPDGTDAPAVEVERPANADHGDFATNLAMKLVRSYRRPPLEIARALAAELTNAPVTSAQSPRLVARADVAAPGFVNMRIADSTLERLIERILATPTTWGRSASTHPQRINVEFVSANPTGPLHIGNARGAFVGDLLCRVLEAAGHRSEREYYFNDFGAQVRNLGASVLAIRLGQPIPEDGYHGDYVHDLAKELPDDIRVTAEVPGADGATIVGTWASEQVRRGIEQSLERLGVHFDVWKTESSLHDDGWVARAIDRLRASGHIYEQNGATWFRSTELGDDKDRVVYRSNGAPTYFAADIGYVAEKFSRGFDHLIYIWGADHHGTVARLRNAAEAMGFDKAAVEVLLIAWVRFIRDGVEISMSKRTGEFITLDDLLAEIGVDAARWFFASRAPSTGIDFDIELAKKQSNENPVYYVQYAHARIASIVRKAAESGLYRAPSMPGGVSGEPEAALARVISRLPDVVEDAAAARETQGVTAYATELATTFHAFYRDARVVDLAAPDRSRLRLALVEAAQVTLASALGLLGISAPESM